MTLVRAHDPAARRGLGLLLLLLLASCAAPGAREAPTRANPTVLLATTTSFQDSGLLDVLVTDFERRTGYRVKASAVGTGQALAMGERGDADVLFVHSPKLEEEFMAKGLGERRLLVMHNDFVLVGPPEDPARVRGLTTFEAFRAIAAARATFISRGDKSGTDVLERDLWRQAGITPGRPWYLEAGTGMGQTLVIASEKAGYTLSDRGTFLARRDPLRLAILVEKDPPLINLYHVITVNPRRFPRVNAAGASAFADHLVSAEAQRLIGAFGLDRFGQPLFFPDAGKRAEEVKP